MAHGHIYFILLKSLHVTESQMFSGDLSMVLLIISFIYSVYFAARGDIIGILYMEKGIQIKIDL